MSQSFECGDTSALVAYLYDECETDEQTAVAEHVEHCTACAGELEGLGWTRQQLVAWTPPVADLDFRMPARTPEVRLPWWRSPLPAWAQAAAAIVIFAAGLTVGLTRSAVPVPDAPSAVAQAPVVAAPVSRTDLSTLEQRLTSQIADLRQNVSAAPAKTPTSGEAIMRQVRTLLEQSEERQRRDFTLRSVQLARDLETQRRVDLATVRETLGQLQGVTGAEIRQQREAIDRINNFITVSQQGR